jgi:competence protein ComEA
MPTPPPFVLPPDRLTDRLRDHASRLLAAAGRQRVVLAIVALLALACAAVIWFRGTPRPLDPTLAGVPSAASGPALTPAPTSAAGVEAMASSRPAVAGEAAGAAMLAVDVVGRVRHPGLVRLPVGSRVVDAIRAAGGAAPGAALDAVNLARKLADGEQLRVPRHGEPLMPPATGQPGLGTGTGGAGGTAAVAGQPSAPLDLNTATAEQLDTLPGVGQVTADRIIAWRSEHPFTSVDDLRQVPGIGDRRFALLKDLVTVSSAP